MTTIQIGSNLGIEGAAELREQLLKPASAKGRVTVSIERIDQLHSAALQVLCAFVRDRAAAKGTTQIDAPKELHTAAMLLGIADTLGLTLPAEAAA